MENLDKIYVVHTQYYEDYNMEASSWDERILQI
ncbi:MAG: hypothetical protein CM15mV66_010 [uncultured marine virus]|nr:MAG: hypothetical protein CM15mV66_010 [uncultured marine virus]